MRNKENVGQVILDVDGVITTDVDPDNPAYVQVIDRSLKAIGVDLPDRQDRVMSHWGMAPKRIFLKFLEDSFSGTVVEKQRAILRKEGVRIFDEVVDNHFDSLTRAIPGVNETVSRLIDEGMVLAVNSASEYRVLRDITFPKAGLDIGMFDDSLVLTSDRLTENQEKPCPYPINQIVETSGIPKDKTVMVGDSYSDIYCADQAGVTPVVVLTGNIRSRAETRLYDVDVDPNHVIESLTHIDEVIYRSLGWAGLTNCGINCKKG